MWGFISLTGEMRLFIFRRSQWISIPYFHNVGQTLSSKMTTELLVGYWKLLFHFQFQHQLSEEPLSSYYDNLHSDELRNKRCDLTEKQSFEIQPSNIYNQVHLWGHHKVFPTVIIIIMIKKYVQGNADNCRIYYLLCYLTADKL